MELNSFLMEQFDKGGPLMWPLLACSLVALTVILERVWVLARVPGDEAARRQTREAVAKAADLPPEELLEALERGRGVLPAVYASVLRKHLALSEDGGEAADHRSELAREADLASREYLGQYFPVLATVGSIAPLLGLLGTITGMIKAFASIAAAGMGDPAQVAEGISEALITTASGLTIAIPVIVVHRYLAVRAGAIMRRLEPYTHAMGRALLAGGSQAESP